MPTTSAAREPQITRPGSGSHYVIDGVEYPRITTVLNVIAKPALMPWAVKLERAHVLDAAAALYQAQHDLPLLSDEAYRKTITARLGTPAHRQTVRHAQDVGTEAHALVEAKMRIKIGEPGAVEPVVSDEALWAAMACEDWARANQVQPIAIEQTVWSASHRFAGTMDLFATVGGEAEPMVIDYKSGKRIYRETAFLQNVAYQVAWAEMGHGPIAGGLIVRLPKDGEDTECEAVRVPAVDPTWPIVEAALALWRWKSSHEARR